MQLAGFTTTLALLALALSASASPQPNLEGKRAACRRADDTVEVREWDGSMRVVTRADGCTLANAGGAGFPAPNSWCKSTYGQKYPCCVENGIGGAFCTECTRGVHNC
ncbi:hypothetical protein C8Q76DRAFT_689452 [Earliella scabrosa]|nr:hypothetical protein C8Q76DRAFT_689452 [Earliella scabrosa]